MNYLTRLAGFEPATYGFVVRAPEFSNLLNLLKLLENLFFILADFPYIPRFSSFWRKSHIPIHIPEPTDYCLFLNVWQNLRVWYVLLTLEFVKFTNGYSCHQSQCVNLGFRRAWILDNIFNFSWFLCIL